VQCHEGKSIHVRCSIPFVHHLIETVESCPYLSGTSSTRLLEGGSSRVIKLILANRMKNPHLRIKEVSWKVPNSTGMNALQGG